MGTTLPHDHLNVQRLVVSGSQGDNTLLAAVTGKRIRVIGGVLSANGTTAISFKSGTTAISGVIYMGGSGTAKVLPELISGYVETAAGEALVLNVVADVSAGGMLTVLIGE